MTVLPTLDDYGRREGTDVEAYAQGLLQSPATQGHQGGYGALGREHGL